MIPATVVVTGAAGFIGSHLVDRLLHLGCDVLGIDNLSHGSMRNLASALEHRAFSFAECDLNDLTAYRDAISGRKIATVWHLVANADIVRGVEDPYVDLRDTFQTTFNTLMIMREWGVERFAFTSSSAVYGVHAGTVSETSGPLFPISNYGAMKLACEGIVSASVERFLRRAWIFRLPNVVGARPTHGVIYDFLRKLRSDPRELEVLGDGNQRKSYVHINDAIDAMLLIVERAPDGLSCYNVGGDDDGVSVREIADSVVRTASPGTMIRYTGGCKGWAGDVPSFRYCSEKLKALGWSARLGSRGAVEKAISEIHAEMCMEQR